MFTDSLLMSGAVTDPFFGNVTALLHFNGTNGSTTFTDQKPNTWSRNGSPTISTAQSQFGGASGVFSSVSSDYIYTSNATGFQFGSGDFTIEGFFRANTAAQVQYIYTFSNLAISSNTDNSVTMYLDSGGHIGGQIFSGTTAYTITGTTVCSNNTWYYMKMYRSGSTMYLYLNTNQEGTVSVGSVTANTPGSAVPRFARYSSGAPSLFSGYLDEWRITKGVARTTNVVPTSEFPNG